MAESATWRADRETWVQTFREQLALSDVGGTAFSNIALDYRRVAGGLDIEATIDQLVRTAAAEGWLVRKLASSALDLRPPTGFFREFLVGSDGSRAGTLDVKHGGMTLITNLARTFAVASGVASNRTIDRLRAASSLGALDRPRRRARGGVPPPVADQAAAPVRQLRTGEAADDQGRSPSPRPADTEESAGGLQADHGRSTCARDDLRLALPMSAPPVRPRGIGGGPWRRAAYASLDFETTGLDLDGDDIISFGVIPDRGREDRPRPLDVPRGPARPPAEARVDRRARSATRGSGRGVYSRDGRGRPARCPGGTVRARVGRRDRSGVPGEGVRASVVVVAEADHRRPPARAPRGTDRRRSPPGLLAHSRGRSARCSGRAPTSRARRCADHGRSLPRPAAGAGAARDHHPSTAAPSKSRMTRRFPGHDRHRRRV